jgi:hypothetical protein
MGTQLEGIKFDSPIKLTFTVFKSSNRKIDRANILCITEKFFCDALVEYGCIVDDNDEYIISTSYYTGGVDKVNPRVEIKVELGNT